LIIKRFTGGNFPFIKPLARKRTSQVVPQLSRSLANFRKTVQNLREMLKLRKVCAKDIGHLDVKEMLHNNILRRKMRRAMYTMSKKVEFIRVVSLCLCAPKRY